MSKLKSETSIGYMSLQKGKIKIPKKKNMLIGHLKNCPLNIPRLELTFFSAL